MADNDELLRILIQLNARQAFPAESLRGIVGSGKYLDAYNMCDGSRTQAEIVKAAKVDQGQFSRTSSRWIQEGVLFKLGAGRDTTLLHLYPLAPEISSKAKSRG
jgi:hypothetical protein